MKTLTDKSLMPFGKHKGTEMANVPADYLLFLYDNRKCSKEVLNYIKENLEVINLEMTRQRKENA